MRATGRRYCNKCGTGNHMGATKCVRCGASIPAFRPEPPPIPKPAPRPTPPSPWWRLAEIVSAWSAPAKFAAVFAVCAALGIAVAASRDSSRRNHVSSAPRGTSGPPNNGHVAQGQMPQPSVTLFGTAPRHTFDVIESGESAWWEIPPGAGSAFAMFGGNNASATAAASRPDNSGKDIGQQALQIMMSHIGGGAYSEYEMSIIEKAIRKGSGTREWKD